MSTAASRCSAVAFAALLVACGKGNGKLPDRVPPVDPTFGTSGGTSTTSGTTTDGEASTGAAYEGPCPPVHACRAGLACRAYADPGPTPTHSEWVCGACVDADAPALWCRDDQSCCDPTHVCELGLCHAPPAADESSTGGSTGA